MDNKFIACLMSTKTEENGEAGKNGVSLCDQLVFSQSLFKVIFYT